MRQHLPNRRASETFNFEWAGFRYVATWSPFDDGSPGEIFLNLEKASTPLDTSVRDAAVLCSLALQFGAAAKTLRQALTRDATGQASGPLGRALDILAAP